jgi:threonylcarbamoyladenosine tRNA methylthiotransferase MtaB
LADVQEQVRILGRQGYAEVVLTGIHLGAWGRDTGEGSLADLLAGLLEVTEVPRYRLSSTEPMEVGDRVLQVMRDSGGRFAEHFHVPLQSGSDAVLRRMNRPYRAGQYADRVLAIRTAFPEAAIGADVIVGFPGETEEEFGESLALVGRLPLTYLHVFAYSDRPGTRSSGMTGKVSPEVIAERSERLRAAGEEKNRRFQEQFRGRTMLALLLRQRAADGRIVGLTGNYLEVLVDGTDEIMNSYAPVRLLDRRPDGRWEAELAGTLGRDHKEALQR